MATEVWEKEILQCLLKSIEESIPISFDERKIELGKSLEGMLVFNVREIEDHKKESGWEKWCDNWTDKWERPLI